MQVIARRIKEVAGRASAGLCSRGYGYAMIRCTLDRLCAGRASTGSGVQGTWVRVGVALGVGVRVGVGSRSNAW